MIATTNAQDTLGKDGQECINTSFLSLQRYIDSYTPSLNKQDFHCVDYTGRISTETVLKCDAPNEEMNVYGSPGDGALYCIGKMDRNGDICFGDISKVPEVSTSTVSWSTTSSSTICPYSGGLHVYDTCTFTSWTCPHSVNYASYCYYEDGCILATDLNGSPIMNADCARICTMKNGTTVYSDYCTVDRCIRRQEVIEQFMVLPEKSSLNIAMQTSSRRLALGDVFWTSSYKCICRWDDGFGNIVCSPMAESPDDTVVYGYCYRGSATVNPNYTYNVFPWSYSDRFGQRLYGADCKLSLGVMAGNKSAQYAGADNCCCLISSADSIAIREEFGMTSSYNPSNWSEGTYCCMITPRTSVKQCWCFERQMGLRAHTAKGAIDDIQYNRQIIGDYVGCGTCIRCCTETIPGYSVMDNPNGIHTNADGTVLCTTKSVDWDFEKGWDSYKECIDPNAYNLVMCKVKIAGPTGTLLQSNACYFLLDGREVCQCAIKAGDNDKDYTCEESRFGYYGAVGVMKRCTCLYHVDETIYCYHDFSKCIWCIYMEYV